MSFTDNKITDGDITSQGVQSKPNKLTGTAAQNKAAFDNLVSAVVKAKLNGLIDDLMKYSAAAEIGVETFGSYTQTNLQAMLEAIVDNVNLAVAAQLTPGSVKHVHIDDNAVEGNNIKDGVVTEDKLDTATLDYETVNLADEQVVPIYVVNTSDFDPSDPPANDGIYLVWE